MFFKIYKNFFIVYTKNMTDKLKIIRAKKNLTQKEVAKKLKVKQQSISHWEQGRLKPSWDHIVALCHLYDVSPCFLMDWERCNNDALKKINKKIEELYVELGAYLDK